VSYRVSLKHDGPDDGSDGMAREGPPSTQACDGVWPIGQDGGPPDFILHVLSSWVINVHYCTYCTS